MSELRMSLESELINVLVPHRQKLPFEDIKAQFTIILSEYDIEPRKTEIVVRDEDKNKRFLALFLASKASSGRTDKTLNFYKSYLTKIFDAIGKSVDEITSDDIKLYLAKKIRVDGISKVSADNERRALSSFFNWLQLNDYITKNPMAKVENMKYTKPKKTAFTDMEVEQIRNACKNERETAIVEMLLSTWCRVSELVGMKIEEIENDKIIVHGKGEKDRIVYLNAKSQLALNNYLSKRNDNNPYIFPKSSQAGSINRFAKGIPKNKQAQWYERPELVDDNEHCDKGTIESIVRNIGKRAGVKNVHPHRFRRTGATFALRTGMPFMTISKLLGHANIAVTQVYLDINDEDLENEHGKYVR